MTYLTNSNLARIARGCVVILLAVLFSLLAYRVVRLVDRLESVSKSAEDLIHSATLEVKRQSEGVASSKEKVDSLITNADELVQSWKRRRLFPLESGETENDQQN